MIGNNIIGNEKVKKSLEKAIDSNNIVHSYLFIGKEGIGKKEIAVDFAKKILCLTKEETCTCKSCTCFDSNNHSDFFIINPLDDKKIISVDMIRTMIDEVYKKPILSDSKVFIINDADKMNESAQNALLKTLEEPPEYAYIILVASNELLLLNTIKSRTMRVSFNDIPSSDVEKYLKENTDIEKVSSSLLEYIGGSIGKSLKVIEDIDKYNAIENFLQKTEKEDIVDYFYDGKNTYTKEFINQSLEYSEVVLMEFAKENRRYLNCIKYVDDCINRLSYNANFDMSIDMMLFKIWEEVNENSSRH